jgi:hypothetical protein
LKNQENDLLEQLKYSRQILPDCKMVPEHKNYVNSALINATNQLKIHKNFAGAKSLFDSVSNSLDECAPPANLKSSSGIVVITLFFILFLIPVIFGIKWYKARRLKRQNISE